jgi:hypothetical protein
MSAPTANLFACSVKLFTGQSKLTSYRLFLTPGNAFLIRRIHETGFKSFTPVLSLTVYELLPFLQPWPLQQYQPRFWLSLVRRGVGLSVPLSRFSIFCFLRRSPRFCRQTPDVLCRRCDRVPRFVYRATTVTAQHATNVTYDRLNILLMLLQLAIGFV